MENLSRYWVQFGEYGNFTDHEDWESDNSGTLVASFPTETFYTLHSERPMENGIELATVHSVEKSITDKIHALNPLNLDQAFTTTKRELLEKLK